MMEEGGGMRGVTICSGAGAGGEKDLDGRCRVRGRNEERRKEKHFFFHAYRSPPFPLPPHKFNHRISSENSQMTV